MDKRKYGIMAFAFAAMAGIVLGISAESGPILYLVMTGTFLAVALTMLAGCEYEEEVVALSSTDWIGQYRLADQITVRAMERFVHLMVAIMLVVCFANPFRVQ